VTCDQSDVSATLVVENFSRVFLRMDALTLFGLFAVIAMLVFYALEDFSPWYVLAFAAACMFGSIYGFLQGAWPFGVLEAVWAAVATLRWRARMRVSGRPRR
jgi:hypothetical protein